MATTPALIKQQNRVQLIYYFFFLFHYSKVLFPISYALLIIDAISNFIVESDTSFSMIFGDHCGLPAPQQFHPSKTIQIIISHQHHSFEFHPFDLILYAH